MAQFETSEHLPKYFRAIAKSTPLTSEQEREVGLRIQAGDQSAIEELFLHNLKIVVTIANKHIGQGVPISDLIQEGNIGLLEAATRFDPSGGTRFISYAQLWIRKRINEAVAKHGRIVRIPHNQEYDIYKAKKAGEEVASLTPIYLDAPISGEEETSIGDIILAVQPEIESSIEFEGTSFMVRKALTKLSDRDGKIVAAYFGIGHDYAKPTEQIAEELGLTQVRVSQIIKAALAKIKESI